MKLEINEYAAMVLLILIIWGSLVAFGIYKKKTEFKMQTPTTEQRNDIQ